MCSDYTVGWLGEGVFLPPLLFRGCLDQYSLGGGIPVGSGEMMEGDNADFLWREADMRPTFETCEA